MKIRLQLTPALTAALLGAAGWFAFWLFAFRPAPLQPPVPPARPEVTRLVTDDKILRKLKAPTLFALPAADGFSGRFVENRVDLRLTLEKPASPVRFLPPDNTPASGINRTLLPADPLLEPGALPVPGTAPHRAELRTEDPRMFLSPKLELRAAGAQKLNIAAQEQPETIRVNLTVGPDGTVDLARFDAPVTNAALLSAVRQLKFKPADGQTEGWIDIRFAQKEKK